MHVHLFAIIGLWRGDKVRPKKTTISEKELSGNKEAEDVCPVMLLK